MTDTFYLSATKRESTNNKHSAREARAQNRVPGVVYGHNIDPLSISINASDLLRIYRKAGTASLLDLDIEGKKIKVLIHALELHPIQDDIRHVDLYAVNLKEKTTVEVPLEFIGESPAVKNMGGVFMTKYHSIEVRCLPTEIPQKIEVDLSTLENIHDHICAKDLSIPKNVELIHIEPEIVICTILGKASATEEEEAVEEIEGGVENEEKSEE